MFNVQTTESGSTALCTITFRSAINAYALTVTDMLTNYTWCTLLYTMEADEVVYNYKILSDNRNGFRNRFFNQVALM